MSRDNPRLSAHHDNFFPGFIHNVQHRIETGTDPASIARRDAGIQTRRGGGHAGGRAVVHAVIIGDVAAAHRLLVAWGICNSMETGRNERSGAGKNEEEEHEAGQFVGHGLFRLVHGMHRDVKMRIFFYVLRKGRKETKIASGW